METLKKRDSLGRIPELDGLRGIAIGTVLCFHYFVQMTTVRPATLFTHIFWPGRLAWSGVDLFFVLSGFLIGGILMDARDSANYFQVFYTRRFFRIVPAYVLLLISAFTLTSLLRSTGVESYRWLLNWGLPWLPHAAFLQNFWMAANNRLGSEAMSITWSLAVEEQFYLTLPLLIWLVPVRKLAPVLAGGILLAPVLRIALYHLWPGHPVAEYTLMPCRADSLLLGVLGALAVRDERWEGWVLRRRYIFWMAIGILGAGMALFTRFSPNPFSQFMATIGYSWLAVFYACILVYAVTDTRSALSRFLRWSWLRWLGTIAYGVYLFHQLILGLVFGLVTGKAPLITNGYELLLSVLALFITLVFCRLSWIYFEKPLVQLGHGTSYMAAARRSEA